MSDDRAMTRVRNLAIRAGRANSLDYLAALGIALVVVGLTVALLSGNHAGFMVPLGFAAIAIAGHLS